MKPLSIALQLEDNKLSTNSINFFVPGNEYDTFIDEDLPTPSYIVPGKNGYFIGWLLDGYTHTFKGIDFRNDILKKYSLVLNATIKQTPPGSFKQSKYYNGIQYELNVLNDHIRDIRVSTRSLSLLHSGDDVAFNIIRSEAYKMKRDGTLNQEMLLDFGLRVIPELNIKKKSHGDIKSKVRNIFEWTSNFYNAGTKKRVSLMTRAEAGANARRVRSLSIQGKVFSYLETLYSMGTNILKLSIKALSKILSIHWTTAKKYLSLFLVLKNKSTLLKEHIPLMVQLECICFDDITKMLFLTPGEYAKMMLSEMQGHQGSIKEVQVHHLKQFVPCKQSIGVDYHV